MRLAQIEIASLDPAKTQDSFAMLGCKLDLIKKHINFTLAHQWQGRNYTSVEKDISIRHQKKQFPVYLIETNAAGHHVVDVLNTVYKLPIIPVATVATMEHPNLHPNSMDKVETARWAMQYKVDPETGENRINFPDPKIYPQFHEPIRQIENYESIITKTGKESFSAPQGDHDDYVSCFLLICWWARKRYFGLKSSDYSVINKKYEPRTKLSQFGNVGSIIPHNSQSVRRQVYFPR